MGIGGDDSTDAVKVCIHHNTLSIPYAIPYAVRMRYSEPIPVCGIPSLFRMRYRIRMCIRHNTLRIPEYLPGILQCCVIVIGLLH